MARDDQRIFRQRQQPGVKRTEECLGVATGQVSAAHRAGKQCVAGQEQFLLREVETDASRSVTGRVDDLCLDAGDSRGRVIFGTLVQLDLLRRRDAEPAGLHVQHGEQGQVGLMKEHRRSGDALQLRGPANVIDMGVGHDYLSQREVVTGKPCQDVGDLVARINHHGLCRVEVCQQGAVAVERADGEGLAKKTSGHVWMVAR
jgi:hypothetical protein